MFFKSHRFNLTVHPVGELAGKFRSQQRLAFRSPRSADDRHTVFTEIVPEDCSSQVLCRVGVEALHAHGIRWFRSAPFLFQAASKILVVIRVSSCTADEGEEAKAGSRNPGKKKPREGLRREPFTGFKIVRKDYPFPVANKTHSQRGIKQITHRLFTLTVSGISRPQNIFA